MRRATFVLIAAFTALHGSAALSQDADKAEESPKARFWQAQRVLLGGDPASAAELFRVIHSATPEDPVADDCLFWIGRCYLRLPDHEPESVVALNRLIRDYPASPFVDDAARELQKLGDRGSLKVLRERLAAGGENAEVSARALAELGDPSGIDWLEKRDLRAATAPAPAEDGPAPDLTKELALLREQVARLRKQVEDSMALVKKLAAEKARKEEDE